MMYNPPKNTVMLITNPEIHPTWCAALLEDGTILNRWDPVFDAHKYKATETYINEVILEYYTMPED